MCLIGSCEYANEINDKEKAIYGGVNSFNGDYIKYIDALFGDDSSEKKENFLMNSKDYYFYLEKKLPKEIYDLNLISNYIISKVNFILNIIK